MANLSGWSCSEDKSWLCLFEESLFLKINQRNFKYDLQAVVQTNSYFFHTISKLNSQLQITVRTASVAHQGQLSWIWLQSTHHFLYSVRRKIPYLVKYVLVYIYVLYVVLCTLYSRQYTRPLSAVHILWRKMSLAFSSIFFGTNNKQD